MCDVSVRIPTRSSNSPRISRFLWNFSLIAAILRPSSRRCQIDNDNEIIVSVNVRGCLLQRGQTIVDAAIAKRDEREGVRRCALIDTATHT